MDPRSENICSVKLGRFRSGETKGLGTGILMENAEPPPNANVPRQWTTWEEWPGSLED